MTAKNSFQREVVGKGAILATETDKRLKASERCLLFDETR
jgi:hypothetical protein